VAVRSGDGWAHAGQVGSGIDTRTRRELRAKLDELARDTSVLDPVPRLKGAHWVEPKLVIRVEFADWTADNLLRQAAFKGLEIGKAPTSVRREREVDAATATAAAERKVHDAPTQTEDAAAALEAMEGKGGIWLVAGRELRVTNLDKVLFPARDGGEPVTKRDLFRYHLAVGPTLVPYLRDRGLTVQRFPNGVEAKGFWQKDLPKHAPAWVKRWTYHHREEGPKDYPVVDEPATLLWLAQEAAIELHPWTSPAETPDRPSYALIDIDPGPDTTWDEVVALARLFRTALSHLGVRGYPKVTGKRGIQVWIRIRTGPSFADTSAWVEGLSRAVGSTVPDLVSWEWSKRARRGKARLDYTQNAINKTLVAPYSPRPAAGAPVSIPISWDELEDSALRPDRWTIREVPARLAEVGDPFASVLTDAQDLPPLG
jgi:bifunctional non-homologous end joining protein LigD